MSVNLYFCVKGTMPYDYDRLFKKVGHGLMLLSSSPDVFGETHNEIKELERLLHIDLSMLRKYPYLEPPIDQLDYQKYEDLENNGETEEREAYWDEKIKLFEKEWEQNYPHDFEDWTPIQDFKSFVLDFKEQILQNPNLYLEINIPISHKKRFPANDLYFSLLPQESTTDIRLYKDLDDLLNFILKAEELDEKYVGLVWL